MSPHLPLPGTVFPRNQPQVCAHLLGRREAAELAEQSHERDRCHRPDTWYQAQPLDERGTFGYLLQTVISPLELLVQDSQNFQQRVCGRAKVLAQAHRFDMAAEVSGSTTLHPNT